MGRSGGAGPRLVLRRAGGGVEVSVERIDVEVEVYRRKPEDFADIVVYEDDARTSHYMVIECKQERLPAVAQEQAIKQAWGNANNLGAAYAGVVIGSQVSFFNPKTFD